MAIVKAGKHSKDIFGNDGAGKKLGPFVVKKKLDRQLNTIDKEFYNREFSENDFILQKVKT